MRVPLPFQESRFSIQSVVNFSALSSFWGLDLCTLSRQLYSICSQ